MTNELYQTNSSDQTSTSFGARLKSTREAAGLDRKDAATNLRLNESMIVMMENENYPSDLPVTFIRGYIRSYAKLLDIPEPDVTKALEPLKPKAPSQEMLSVSMKPTPVTSSNYFMQFFTYAIVITMVGLVGTWWHTHTAPPSASALDAPAGAPTPSNNNLPITPPLSNNTVAPASPLALNTGTPSADLEEPALAATPDTQKTLLNTELSANKNQLSQNKPVIDPYDTDSETTDTSIDNAD